MTLALITAGGFLGALGRYFAGRLFHGWLPGDIPMATFLVNGTGSFLLGLIVGISATTELILFLGTGFLGAFTTFSTINLEIVQLVDEGKWASAFGYIFLTYAGGLLSAFLGILAGYTLS
ncbi:MAG TPA: CrcB family protein [Bacillaceae bacterium]